jgi:alkyl hydroperoxide reductase subunit D
MNLEAIKDTKINFERVLNETDTLTREQIALIAFSCAYALRHNDLQQMINSHFFAEQTESLFNAAKICASLMAMNNVYYRFTHLVQDKSFSKMNPMLRMSGLGNHGVNSIDFELAALAVSALNGCGMCMDAHTEKLKKEQASLESIQAAIRIAAVLNAMAVGLSM